jgi:hypothetical protein
MVLADLRHGSAFDAPSHLATKQVAVAAILAGSIGQHGIAQLDLRRRSAAVASRLIAAKLMAAANE